MKKGQASPAALKAKRELDIFRAFAGVCPLGIDPSSVRNEVPPMPDIYCEIGGRSHYFELGRVLDEGLAKRMAHSLKTGEITGGAFSQDRPLVRILEEKAVKTYPVAKKSLDLLIYYDEQLPLPEALLPETKGTLFVFAQSMTLCGEWNRIWFYDHFSRQILDFHPDL